MKVGTVLVPLLQLSGIMGVQNPGRTHLGWQGGGAVLVLEAAVAPQSRKAAILGVKGARGSL